MTDDTASMAAWVCRRYGGPETLILERRPVPQPRRGEVLIRTVATSITSADARIRACRFPRGFGAMGRVIFGFTGPRQGILGSELAGVIADVGEGVTAWKPGDAVIAFPGVAMRAHAEYVRMPANGRLAAKPANLSFDEAASLCFGGSTALHYLRKAKLSKGERLLVIGASGAVGSAMIQLGRYLGADVTGVSSAANAALVQSLGAGHVIDYAAADPLDGRETFDVIADTIGCHSFAASLRALNENGRFLAIAGDLAALFAGRRGTRRSIAGPAAEKPQDVAELARLAADGTLRPVIDSIVPFSRLPDAHARADTGRKRGSVVVSLS